MMIKQLSSKTRRAFGEAIHDFEMIREGDSILIGLSGGKDSMLLLLALNFLQRKSPVSFNLRATMIDCTDKNLDLSPWINFSGNLGVPLDIVHYPIFDIIKRREERSPCSLCANLRRGILASRAKELECNCIALGHHKDDAIETLFLNLFYAGHLKTFHPHMYMNRSKIRVVRPMVYLDEAEISAEVKKLDLPVLNQECPFAADTGRAKIKETVSTLALQFPDLKSNVVHALRYFNANDIWIESFLPS